MIGVTKGDDRSLNYRLRGSVWYDIGFRVGGGVFKT